MTRNNEAGTSWGVPGRLYTLYFPAREALGKLAHCIPLSGFQQMLSPDIRSTDDIEDILRQEWAEHWVLLDAQHRPCGLVRVLPELTGGISIHGMGWVPKGGDKVGAQRAYTSCWIALHTLLFQTHPVVYSYAWRANQRALRTLRKTGYAPLRIREVGGTQVYLQLHRERFLERWPGVQPEPCHVQPHWTPASSAPAPWSPDIPSWTASPWTPSEEQAFMASTEGPWGRLLPRPEKVILKTQRILGRMTVAKPRADLHHAVWHPQADWTHAASVAQALQTHLPARSTVALDAQDPGWHVLMNSMGRYMGQGAQGQPLWQWMP